MQIKSLLFIDRNGIEWKFRTLIRNGGDRHWAQLEDNEGNTMRVSARGLMRALNYHVFGGDF